MIKFMVVGCISLWLGLTPSGDFKAYAGETTKEMSAKTICMGIASKYPDYQERCVACVNAGESVPECICQNIPEKDMSEDGRLENLNQCVKEFAHILKDKRVSD